MKKLFALMLAVLMVLSMAACGASDSGDSQTDGQDAAVVKSDDVAETTEAAETTAAPANAATPVLEEDLVLVDNENCTFKVTGFDPNGLFGYTVSVYLENKTDKELMFTLTDVSVNGFMCDPFWAETVTAGMKSNTEFSFFAADLAVCGISDVTDIDMTVDVYDSVDYMADHLVTESFTVYPLGEDAVQPFTRQSVDGEIVLIDNESCTMIITGVDPDNMWGYALNVYLENKTDKSLMFSISDAAVNGFMCDPFWADEVAPGKRACTTISWLADDFTANGITEVETLNLPITVYDADDWMADYLVNETVEVNMAESSLG